MRIGGESGRLAGLALLSVIWVASAAAADFSGGGAAIPDNNPAGVNIGFNVTGLTTPVERVRLSLTLTHPFAGDLVATLRSPFGISRLVVFGRVGFRRSGNAGTSADFSGTYVFDDLATADLWASAAGLSGAQAIPPGSYRTSTAGAPGVSDIGGCTTRLAPVFGGLSGSVANGSWTLNIADLAGGDIGQVTASVLSIDTSAALFRGGFEGIEPAPPASATLGTCRKAFHDYSGNGLSDYVLVRNTGGGPGGAVTWFVQTNDGTANGALRLFTLGIAGDVFAEGDFDGDGISDGVVYRVSDGTYLIARSSRGFSDPMVIGMGSANAVSVNPRNIGDYDGDGLTDATLYRPGANAGNPSQTLIRLSTTGQFRALTTGENGHFHSGGIDFNGNGLADVVMQSNGGGGQGRFRLFDGISGAQFLDVLLGTPTDVIVTGNHVGNARADLTVARSVSGAINWTTRDTFTGTVQPVVVLGASATDSVLTGNYDGDLLDDYAVFRPSATPGESKFIIRRSTSPGTPFEVNFGQNGDYPVANTRIN